MLTGRRDCSVSANLRSFVLPPLEVVHEALNACYSEGQKTLRITPNHLLNVHEKTELEVHLRHS